MNFNFFCRSPDPISSSSPPTSSALLRPATGTSSSQLKMPSLSPFDFPDSAPPSGLAPASFSSGDLYSNLSTFSFGAASTAPRSDVSNLLDRADSFNDSISPLDSIQPDTTPRPSVYAGHPNQISTSSAPSPLTPSQTCGVSDCGFSSVISHPALRPGDPGTSSSGQRTSHEGKDHVTSPDARTRPSSRGDKHSTPRTSDGDERAAFVHRLSQEGDDVAYDTASIHTFGPGGTVPSLRSGLSSRSSSRAEHGEEDSEPMFSSDAESEIIYEEDLIPALSVTGVDQGIFAITDPLLSHRRDSLPVDIPGSASSPTRRSFLNSSTDLPSRTREGSLLTLRRPSRSVDDDLRALSVSVAVTGSEPQSEPLSRVDWRTLDLQMQVRQSGEEKTEEFNPKYIFNIPSATGLVPPATAAPSPTPETFGGSRRSSDALSYLQRRPSRIKVSGFVLWGRRHSTATTISGEDVFEKYLARQDGSFLERRELWSFKKEELERIESGSTPRKNSYNISDSGNVSLLNAPSSEKGKEKEKQKNVRKYISPGGEETWRCPVVGKFVVAMQEVARKLTSSFSSISL
jgi:hypothetical protein